MRCGLQALSSRSSFPALTDAKQTGYPPRGLVRAFVKFPAVAAMDAVILRSIAIPAHGMSTFGFRIELVGVEGTLAPVEAGREGADEERCCIGFGLLVVGVGDILMGVLMMGEETSGAAGVPIAVGVEGIATSTLGVVRLGVVGVPLEASGAETVRLLTTTADLRRLIFTGGTALTLVSIGDKSDVRFFSAPVPKLSSMRTLSLKLFALTKSATAWLAAPCWTNTIGIVPMLKTDFKTDKVT